MRRPRLEGDARDTLARVASACSTLDEYVNVIWTMRYPAPSLKASARWPMRKRDQEATRAVRVVRIYGGE